jgi:hypothetical protein
MQSISESRAIALLARIGPPFICLVEYLVIASAVVLVRYGETDSIIKAIMVLLVCLGLIMIPFWYRAFFDRSFIGPDRTVLVQWSADHVVFSGAYHRLEVAVTDILGFQRFGFFVWGEAFILRIRIRRPNGKLQSVQLSTTMPGKQQFVSFVERSRSGLR